MIDQFSDDGTGWARFSDDMSMRYRLARSLDGEPLHLDAGMVMRGFDHINRVVFLMLNPSTADAFQLDPTIKRCVSFARSWGADALEVVNIFALRSTIPEALYVCHADRRGDDAVANLEILGACNGALRVVAGWGKHGSLNYRGRIVRDMLSSAGIKLHHLGLNKDRSPKHPLYLKASTEPQEWP